MKNNNIIFGIYLIAVGLTFMGCKKFVDVESPDTSLNSDNVYEKDVTAASVLTSIYTKISASGIQSENLRGISYFTGLSADELSVFEAVDIQELSAYYTNNLTSQVAGSGYWNNIYPVVYVINAALEGVETSSTLTSAVKQQLLGEAKFMRAFCFFYLLNLYGDIPLVLTTDYKTNSLITRTPKELVWQQIVEDLKSAQVLLSENYLDATLLKQTTERVRPTKAAATALLARVYLYTNDWVKADEQATDVLNSQTYELTTLTNTFRKNNTEAIWQLPSVMKGFNTAEAGTFIIDPVIGFNYFQPTFLSKSLIDVFEPGDQRKTDWTQEVILDGIAYSYPYKYKIKPSNDLNEPINEYSTILRLAEQYLIRAESKIQQGKTAEGIEDLNILRDRATDKTANPDVQLKPLSINLSKEDALLAVEHERRVEFFTEWGHRWFDLKRTGRIDAVMSIEVPKKLQQGTWKSYQQLYPIGLGELQNNSKLVQNTGY